LKDLFIQATVSVIITNEVHAALQAMKPGIALYAGGMGATGKNFHNDMMARAGYPEAAQLVQELFLSGRKDEAAAAVPDEYCDSRALIGPPQRIREKFKLWADSGIDGLLVGTDDDEALRLMAQLAA
jgi:alkanesulfonate monooxygenase SsuD/methylene tetrahydromethanopterin reductase-like flavin-dependent oxidoreductase (luciferase family)